MGVARNKAVGQKGHVDSLITDDLSSAIDSLRLEPENFGDCLSVLEVMEKTGICRSRAYKFVKESIENGTCEFVGKRSGVGIDGRTIKSPVYKFKFKKKKK